MVRRHKTVWEQCHIMSSGATECRFCTIVALAHVVTIAIIGMFMVLSLGTRIGAAIWYGCVSKFFARSGYVSDEMEQVHYTDMVQICFCLVLKMISFVGQMEKARAETNRVATPGYKKTTQKVWASNSMCKYEKYFC